MARTCKTVCLCMGHVTPDSSSLTQNWVELASFVAGEGASLFPSGVEPESKTVWFGRGRVTLLCSLGSDIKFPSSNLFLVKPYMCTSL